MREKNKYTAYCLDEFDKRKTVTIMANNKIEAKEQVLENHPKYKVTAVLSKIEKNECIVKLG